MSLSALLAALSSGPGAWQALAAQRSQSSGRFNPAQGPRPTPQRPNGDALPAGPPALGQLRDLSVTPLPAPGLPGPAAATLAASPTPAAPPPAAEAEKLAATQALHAMSSPSHPHPDEGERLIFDGARARDLLPQAPEPGSTASPAESPNAGPAAGLSPSRELWHGLQGWAAKALRLTLDEDLSDRWGKLAAQTLRGQPALPLETALARALGQVHHLDDADIERTRAFFNGSPIRADHRVNAQLRRIGGELYAAADTGLYRLGSKGFRRVLHRGHVNALQEALGRIWAATNTGLYVLENGRWRAEPVGKAQNATQVLAIDGKLYAATDDGLYVQSNHGWTREPIHDAKGVHHLAVDSAGDFYAVVDSHRLYYRRHGRKTWDHALIGGGSLRGVQAVRGQVYALAEDGAFGRYDGDKWGDDFGIPGNPKVNELLELDGELYARTSLGLYLRTPAGGWSLIIPGSEHDRPLQRVAKISGRFYYSQRVKGPQRSLYSHELYAWEEGVARLLVDDVGWVYEILEHAGEIFITSNQGLWRIAQAPPGLGSDWRRRVLEEVNAGAARAEPGAAVSGQEPFRLDPERGAIEDSDGRTIFSGFYRLADALMQWAGSIGLCSPLPAGEPSLKDALEALMDKYKVPARDRPLRRRLALEAVERIRADIPLFADNPDLLVRFGPWWLTAQDLSDPNLKEILIPLEDIFLRAADPRGVKEAVGAARHEVAHYLITRPDPKHPLTRKYLLPTSPPANNLLHQIIEDTRINTWTLLQEPGASPYFDALYGADWPENPDDAEALKRSRTRMLARSTLEVKLPGRPRTRWLPPHLQYLNSILYYWRHRKAPHFLEDAAARQAFEKTKASLDWIRHIHPQPIGGAIIEPMKAKAFRESLEAMDREIFPHYQELIEKSRQDMKAMAGQGALFGSGQGDPEEILARMDEDLAKEMAKHGRQGEGRAPPQARGGMAHSPPGPGDASPGRAQEDKTWLARRQKAIAREKAQQESPTTYERYKLRAMELGLISKVDGIIKKLLLPTRHARLSPQVFHEGDEPDMDKHYDDLASGRLDTPIMRRLNRKIRRSAKISLVLDISGSMGGLTEEMTGPLDYALLGIVAWIEVCQKNALDFEVTLFDTDQHVAHPFGKNVDKQAKEHIVSEILARRGGATAIGAAFQKALQSLIRQGATHRFVIFATDEGHNTGEAPETYKALARKNRVVSIALVIGAGAAGAKKHFDFAVRVKEAKNFPRDLLNVLRLAMRSVLGLRGALAALMGAGLHWAQDWLGALGGLGLALP